MPRLRLPLPRQQESDPDLTIKLPRAAKKARSGTEYVDNNMAKSSNESRDLLDLCDLINLPDLMEYHASLRDLPDQLARTGLQLRRDQHGLQQLKAPRVENDPPPKQEVSGTRRFRLAFHRSPIQNRSNRLKKILWPPCLDRDLRCGAVDCRAMFHLLPDRYLPQFQWIPPVPSLDRLLFRVNPHHLQSTGS